MRAPGPKGLPFFGSTFDFRKDPLNFLMNVQERFGGIAFFRLGFIKAHFITDPEYIKQVLQTNNKNYHKAKKYKELTYFLGQGLLTSEGDFWLRQRRLAQPAFHRERIASFAGTMTQYTEEMLEQWKDKKSVDLHEEMMALTLRIAGKTLLGKDLSGEAKAIGDSLSYLIEITNERIYNVFNIPLWVPTPTNLRYKKEMKAINKVILDLIEERKKSAKQYDDLLGMLMEAKDEETGEGMSPEQLRDETMTLFIAGHETTANALSWCLYLLDKNPSIRKKLQEELKESLKGKSPNISNLPQLGYALQIIEESMRLFPPAWVIARHALGDDRIGEHDIKKGDDVIISPYVSHRDPNFWKNANQFDPEHFTNEKRNNYDKFRYYPFGGGPRFCIGNNFALLEMQLVIATICQHYELQTKDNQEVSPDPLVTLRPKGALEMALKHLN